METFQIKNQVLAKAILQKEKYQLVREIILFHVFSIPKTQIG